MAACSQLLRWLLSRMRMRGWDLSRISSLLTNTCGEASRFFIARDIWGLTDKLPGSCQRAKFQHVEKAVNNMEILLRCHCRFLLLREARVSLEVD